MWAPHAKSVALKLLTDDGEEQVEPLVSEEHGARYVYRLNDGLDRPDPASRSQPDGVHGPSEIVDPSFPWTDTHWHGLPFVEHIFYELHVGTFTPEGTFEAVILHLPYLKELGVTAVELMPVAQFPGARNWGYDGAYPFAAQNSYGGPLGLKKLVNAAHEQGLAVFLDVVYNHLGPEGAYVRDFGPYFTDRYQTAWGAAINFDGPQSDEVRAYFIQNALAWVTECHIDGLRLDAIHAIADNSARRFLEELPDAVHRQARHLNRLIHVIAESDLNDARVIRAPDRGGYGMDAQWSDDFHHGVHTLLTGELRGYYRDFGSISHVAKAFSEGYVYSGQWSACRERRHGVSTRCAPCEKFVVFVQNHDQVGNRALGERLDGLVSFEALKLAAGAVLLSPYLPLLFMGEEYGETAPFLYFVSHTDPRLVEAVRKGRQEEFASFGWGAAPPDPQDESTFERSKLHHALRWDGRHKTLLALYTQLIRVRKSLPALNTFSKDKMESFVFPASKALFLRHWDDDDEIITLFNFGDAAVSVMLPVSEGKWRKLLDTADRRWQGPGVQAPDTLFSNGEAEVALAAHSLVVFEKEAQRA